MSIFLRFAELDVLELSPRLFSPTGDLGLEFFLKIHLLQTPILLLERPRARHHGHIHVAELGSSLVKRGRAHTKLAT